ncbi:MAG: hexameric tyrosine-coordinated heme protein [Balneolales bacterium]
MKKLITAILLISCLVMAEHTFAQSEDEGENDSVLSLIAETPEAGFQIAIALARKGVTSTQPDRDVLFMLRDVYAKDPDASIASSQVIAIHLQIVTAFNNYWRDEE